MLERSRLLILMATRGKRSAGFVGLRESSATLSSALQKQRACQLTRTDGAQWVPANTQRCKVWHVLEGVGQCTRTIGTDDV